jgi:hypothetical protein
VVAGLADAADVIADDAAITLLAFCVGDAALAAAIRATVKGRAFRVCGGSFLVFEGHFGPGTLV